MEETERSAGDRRMKSQPARLKRQVRGRTLQTGCRSRALATERTTSQDSARSRRVYRSSDDRGFLRGDTLGCGMDAKARASTGRRVARTRDPYSVESMAHSSRLIAALESPREILNRREPVSLTYRKWGIVFRLPCWNSTAELSLPCGISDGQPARTRRCMQAAIRPYIWEGL
jgi:hypothetical protein